MLDALLEIGCEELPVSYIEPAYAQMRDLAEQYLKDKMLSFQGPLVTAATPRRLVLFVPGVSEKSAQKKQKIYGPPEHMIKDGCGKYTPAALGFSKKTGVLLEDMILSEGKLCVEVNIGGIKAKKIFEEIFPVIIKNIKFPKTMVWEESLFRFARPIRYIVALCGADVIKFSIAGVKSGKTTNSLFTLSSKKIEIPIAGKYFEKLENNCIRVKSEDRKKYIVQLIQDALPSSQGTVLLDEHLLHENAYLVETPAVVIGSFDKTYLELPQEVLITCMKTKQKFFSVFDNHGHIRPLFVGVRNGRSEFQAVVREGYERVLKARLEDAKFFYEQDKKHTFDAWADRLQGVTFHEQLGSMSDKIERIRKLCAWNADSVHLDEIEKKDLDRAGYLCKTDLVSALVYEYPELQGVAGRLYAQHAQEKETICEAIEDHYKPIGQEGELPRSTIGAVLSCADKLDSLVGYFLAGITPSGNKDPLGLRRLAIGIVRIILQFRFSFNMRDMIAQAIHCYPEKIRGQASQITQAVIDFIGQRSESVFSSAGFSADHIHAVLESAWYHAAGESNIYDAYIRLQAIKQVSTLSDFELLSAGFKRADNIIKQAREKNIAIPEQIQETLFQHQAENILMDEFIKIRNILHDINVVNRDMHAYVQIFEKLITLKKPLDNFFNAVMIMDEDNSIRGNRLALLNHIVVFYRNIADFSRIITHASPGS